MNDYPYNLGPEVSLSQRVTQVMKRVYVKMFLALLVSTVAAWITSHSAMVVYMIEHRWVYWGLFIVEIGLVLGLSSGISRMKSSTAAALFYLFAIINGMALSMIFLVYTGDSIFKTFLITAGVFGAMSVYGYTTARDLTQFGTFLRMALFGLVICIVINIFWANSTLEWLISIAGVLIFIGLTAWDTQKIKQMAQVMPSSGYGHLATLGALSLYLDFINLFIYLLRFFGNSRD
ncbi:MAG: Bax inhibitor-1/YccA family protein [Muribaculaceae bacterium]|nr:Bax inhibitor-1/YccA family protein [Muribaculaceae bacterium]